MPILAGIPVADRPVAKTYPLKESRTLGFRSIDGADLLPFTGSEFFAKAGIEGLDLPPRELIRETVPGMDGSRIREIRIGEREIFLPLFVASGSSHAGYLDRRDQLATLFNHRGLNYQITEGTFDLVASSVRGERYLRCLYSDGMKGSLGQDNSGAWWESIGLNLLAVQPYWHGERWETPTIYKPADVSFFGTFPPSLSASRALGVNMPITVKGDVPSWPSVDITGPATNVAVTGPGLSVSIPGGLLAGETATIITDPRKRDALFNGVRDWTRIAPSDRYNAIMPGEQQLSVVLSGATPETTAKVYGDSLYERPW